MNPFTPSIAAAEPIVSGGTLSAHRGNNFDLMRLVFASLVLLAHSFELIDGNRSREPLTVLFHTLSFGEVAVDCFFILSGYLIGASWQRDPNALSFLRKRILRIYPGFIVAFLISVYIVGAIGADQPRTYWHDLQPLALLREILLLSVPSTPPTFPHSSYALANGALWTISYEFACYLMILALGVSGVLAWSRAPAFLWAVALVAFAIFRARHAGDPQTGTIMGSHAANMVRFVPMYLSGTAIFYTKLYRRRLFFLVACFDGCGADRRTDIQGHCRDRSRIGRRLSIGLDRTRECGSWCTSPDARPLLWRVPLRLADTEAGDSLGVTPRPMLVFLTSLALALLTAYASWHLVREAGAAPQ